MLNILVRLSPKQYALVLEVKRRFGPIAYVDLGSFLARDTCVLLMRHGSPAVYKSVCAWAAVYGVDIPEDRKAAGRA